MRTEKRTVAGVFAVLVGCLLIAAVGSTVSADFDEQGSLSADSLVLRNLIGEIEIVGHGGTNFEIEVRVQGSDASADRVKMEISEGRHAEWTIVFPLNESKRYVYPRMKGGNTSFNTNEGSWLSNLFGSGRIKVSGSGSGLEIWADVTVKVPRGKSLVVEHGAGAIRASDVDADLDLDSHSGPVEVIGANGSVSIDTGSGRVTVENVHGNLNIDTGSGRVSIREVTGENVHVDTGSGRVELEGVDSSMLHVDTGSGGVRAEAIRTDSLTIDTGSGSVTVQLDRMGTGRFEIDTGSGGITLRLPADASAEMEAETGSGGIKLDLSGPHDIRYKEDDEARVTIGDGAARLVLDTGSGSIRISQ